MVVDGDGHDRRSSPSPFTSTTTITSTAAPDRC